MRCPPSGRTWWKAEDSISYSITEGSGIDAVTVVPAPGLDRICNRPPTISARSAMDNSP